MIRRIVREPLLHFLALGAAIFLAYAVFDRPAASQQSIVVTQNRIDALVTGFTRTWQRPPSASELKGLVDDYIRQEVYAREARTLGLDRDDIVINRRLRQKLEFVTDDVAAQERPTETQLREYLRAHAELFQTDSRTTFDQVFLSREKHRESIGRDAQELLARLGRAGADADVLSFGDATLLERHYQRARARDIAGQFGEPFAKRLATVKPGAWRGPIESEYGTHLVLVHERIPGEIPSFDEVKDTVAAEWTNARREATRNAFYRELRKRYTVTLEAPGSAGGVPAPDVELASGQSR